MQIKSQKILFLTLHTFSLTGGIEKVSRTLAKALNDVMLNDQFGSKSIKVLSLCDRQIDIKKAYCAPGNFEGYDYHRVSFGAKAVLNGIKSDTIILSHINLLPIAILIKFLSSKKRIIMLAHGIEVWRNLSSWKKYFFQKHVEIWAVSDFTSQVLQHKHQISNTKIKILNNCLDPYFNLPTNFGKPKYLLERYNLKENQPVIITISRLSSFELYKGYDMVISTIPKLLKDLPNLTYILAGKADVKERLRLNKLISSNSLQNHVLLIDFIPENELIDYFLLADIFVMPSKKEGFGLVFIEAAACGCPVIAGNRDGSKDALLNGTIGTLINPDSTKMLIYAIQERLAKGKSQMQGLLLQQKCLSHFSYDRYKKQVSEFLV